MSFNSANLGAGLPGNGPGNDDAYEFQSADQSTVKRQNATLPHVPPDSAEYLGGELPKYKGQGGDEPSNMSNNWTAGANSGEPMLNPSALTNPMDPSAGLD